MRPINQFLLQHGFTLSTNPCISPDFCLDWAGLSAALQQGGGEIRTHERSRFTTAQGEWVLIENLANGDRAWRLTAKAGFAAREVLREGISLSDGAAFPASWERTTDGNLLPYGCFPYPLLSARPPRSPGPGCRNR